MTRKIVFYSDSATFSGHEMMTARLVDTLHGSSPYKPVLLHSHPDFLEHLNPDIETLRLPFSTRTPLPCLRDLHPGEIAHVLRTLRGIDASLVVVAQGDVELGIRGVIAARLAGRKVVSYLPMAYSFAEMGRAIARLRDAIGRACYRLPDAFITIADYQRSLLRRFTEAPIHRVPYPISGTPGETASMSISGPLRVAVIGRLYLPRKRQDAVIDAARLCGHSDFALTFHIVGEGPHRDQLEEIIDEWNLGDRVRMHGWMPKPALERFVDEAIDLVLIPSRFEGVPLVMLEAAAAGKPFLVGSPELAEEYDLPDSLLIDPDDPGSLARKLMSLAATFDYASYRRARTTMLERHAPERFRRRLLRTFDRLTWDA